MMTAQNVQRGLAQKVQDLSGQFRKKQRVYMQSELHSVQAQAQAHTPHLNRSRYLYELGTPLRFAACVSRR